MDFGTLPPEVNSARMYSGPGAAPLLAAATAWDKLATDLGFSASAYSSVIANLVSAGWQGAASTMMTDAVTPYVGWLHATAGRAAQTGTAAKAAAGAYEAAFAATVPPPLIAANRTQLISLIATNFFGQNSPAIAAVEAAYDEMWAQDVAAMIGYAHASAAAAQLSPFSQPPQTVNPAGQAAQNAAVAQAAGAAAGHARDLAASAGAQGVAAATTASAATAAPSATIPVIAGEPITAYAFQAGSYAGMALSSNNEVWRLISLGARITNWWSTAQRDFVQGIGPFSPIFGLPLPPTNAITSTVAAVSPISAVAGQASQVNALSVPPTWTATLAGEITPAAAALPAAAAPEVFVGAPGTALFGETLLGTLAGRAVSAVAANAKTGAEKAHRVVPRSPAAG